MHYDLHLQLSVYQPTIVDSKAIQGLLKELNKIMEGQIKIEFIHNDGWDELDVKIQKGKK